MTTKTLLLGLALSASLMACGGRAKKTTTPDNTTGTTETQPATEGSTEAGALGGTTYGGATAPAGGGADPCGQ